MKKIIWTFLSIFMILIGFTSCSKDDDVAVSGISLDKTSLSITKGETAKLTAVVSPDNATDKTVKWQSSGNDVATVDQSGNVTAVSGGTTTITVTTADGRYSASCVVTVVINASSITLSETNITIEKGKTIILKATVKPDNATYKTINWQSSNASVAMVDQDGVVTAIGKGSTVITASSADGKCFANCIVNVLVNVESITLSETDVTMKKGESKTLTATIYPEDAINRNLTWSTSNSNVATVENGIIKAVNGGTAVVTAATEDGKVKATCNVRVTVPVESITISKEQLSLVVGQKYSLYATILPKDATDKNIKWTSSNTNVVSVDNGQVTAKNPGTAIVSAISQDGDHASSCTITVRKTQNVDYNPYGNGQKW